MCFLIHSGVIANINIGVSRFCNGSVILMLSHYLVFTIAMLIVSFIAYELYRIITRRLFSKLNIQEIPYGF